MTKKNNIFTKSEIEDIIKSIENKLNKKFKNKIYFGGKILEERSDDKGGIRINFSIIKKKTGVFKMFKTDNQLINIVFGKYFRSNEKIDNAREIELQKILNENNIFDEVYKIVFDELKKIENIKLQISEYNYKKL